MVARLQIETIFYHFGTSDGSEITNRNHFLPRKNLVYEFTSEQVMAARLQIETTVGMQVAGMNIHRKVQCFRGCNSQFSDMQEPSDNKQTAVTGPCGFKQ